MIWRPVSGRDDWYQGFSGEVLVGNVHNSINRWHWNIDVMDLIATRISGTVPTLAAAQSAVESAWAEWCARAGLTITGS